MDNQHDIQIKLFQFFITMGIKKIVSFFLIIGIYLNFYINRKINKENKHIGKYHRIRYTKISLTEKLENHSN